ncbi:MAG: BlaI/MecI/CopY family transcriptional regulator [Shewanella sp.]|nr:BlaI/MecI/CopY family transcriptional regulator [Shewanella sp.]
MQLGELEKQVLHYLWQYKTADAKQVFAYFERKRGGTLNTIQSTLDRLFKKDLLTRHKVSYAWHYEPKVEKNQLIAQMIKSVTSDFISDEENSLVAAFSSISQELNEDQLLKLEGLIEQQKRKLQQEK